MAGERYYQGQENKSDWKPWLVGGTAIAAAGSVLGIGLIVALGGVGIIGGGAKWGFEKWRGKASGK